MAWCLLFPKFSLLVQFYSHDQGHFSLVSPEPFNDLKYPDTLISCYLPGNLEDNKIHKNWHNNPYTSSINWWKYNPVSHIQNTRVRNDNVKSFPSGVSRTLSLEQKLLYINLLPYKWLKTIKHNCYADDVQIYIST